MMMMDPKKKEKKDMMEGPGSGRRCGRDGVDLLKIWGCVAQELLSIVDVYSWEVANLGFFQSLFQKEYPMRFILFFSVLFEFCIYQCSIFMGHWICEQIMHRDKMGPRCAQTTR